MAYIDIIQPENAQGELKEIYNQLAASRGKIAEIHKIQSLNPESIMRHIDLYMTIMYHRSPLRRVQREMMAVVVSQANSCEYCQLHHIAAVQHYWKNEEKANRFRADYKQVELSEVDELLCEFAQKLTKHPDKQNHEEMTVKMRNAGLSDRAILDAALVVSYFNFTNRLVLSLGVDIEEDTDGYNY